MALTTDVEVVLEVVVRPWEAGSERSRVGRPRMWLVILKRYRPRNELGEMDVKTSVREHWATREFTVVAPCGLG